MKQQHRNNCHGLENTHKNIQSLFVTKVKIVRISEIFMYVYEQHHCCGDSYFRLTIKMMNSFLILRFSLRYPTKKTMPIIGIFRYYIVVWWSVQIACVYTVFSCVLFLRCPFEMLWYGSAALKHCYQNTNFAFSPNVKLFYHIYTIFPVQWPVCFHDKITLDGN